MQVVYCMLENISVPIWLTFLLGWYSHKCWLLQEIWGPAQAVNPNLKNEDRIASSGSNKNNKKKKRMQKVDSSILGFTVHADTERLNMGEIENTETVTLG